MFYQGKQEECCSHVTHVFHAPKTDKYYPLDTGRKLKVHKTFRVCRGRDILNFYVAQVKKQLLTSNFNSRQCPKDNFSYFFRKIFKKNIWSIFLLCAKLYVLQILYREFSNIFQNSFPFNTYEQLLLFLANDFRLNQWGILNPVRQDRA